MQVDQPAPATIRFDTRVAIVIRTDLAVWQKLNVAAFLASGIGGSIGEVLGVPRDQLSLVGIGVYGPRGAVDKAVRNARLHP